MQKNNGPITEEVAGISDIGYFESDLKSNMWYGSERTIAMMGLDSRKIYKNSELLDIIHPDDREEVISYIRKCLESGTRYECVYRCILPDRRKIVIMTNGSIIRDYNNNPVKIMGIKQDITGVKINKCRFYELADINKRKNEVLGTVAHDLKSPLFSIFGMTEILSENATPEQIDLIKYIREALKTANDIITGLIEIAELEEGGKLLNLTETDVNEIIDQSVKHFLIRASKKNIKIETDFCRNAVAAVDTIKFARIMDNLILNAIKFTGCGGRILISSVNSNEGLNVNVEDNGIGIDPKILPELFNKFTKTKRTGTSGEKSTGLGLSIVKELVELHNWNIKVVSEVNRGSKFTVNLGRPHSKINSRYYH